MVIKRKNASVVGAHEKRGGSMTAKKRNRMTKKEYLHAMFLIAALYGLFFDNYLFHTINGWTTRNTYIVYYLISGLCIIGGTVISFTRHRSISECLQTVSFPGMLFFTVGRISYGGPWTRIIYTAFLILIAAYCAIRALRDGISMHAISQDAYLMVGVLFLSLMLIHPQSAFHKSNLGDMYWQEEHTMSANLDDLAKYDNLKSLTIPERIQLVEKTAVIMRNNLGYPYNPKIAYDNLEDKALGNYNYRKNTITIDVSLLEGYDGYELFRTVCHECYHIYQRSLTEAYENVPKKYRQLLAFNHCDDYLMEERMTNSEYADQYWEMETERMARLYERAMEDRLLELLDQQSRESEESAE